MSPNRNELLDFFAKRREAEQQTVRVVIEPPPKGEEIGKLVAGIVEQFGERFLAAHPPQRQEDVARIVNAMMEAFVARLPVPPAAQPPDMRGVAAAMGGCAAAVRKFAEQPQPKPPDLRPVADAVERGLAAVAAAMDRQAEMFHELTEAIMAPKRIVVDADGTKRLVRE